MTFTEAQQTEIVKVVSTNEFTKGTFADTIESLRASLDAWTITQEQYNEQEEDLALKLYDTSLSQISEEEKSAVETAWSLVWQQLNVAKPATEQKEVLEGWSYTYFDILKESSAYTKMLPFVAPGVTDAKEQDRLMKEWCDKIGGIWRSYVTWSIEDPELFAKSPEAAENIVHGMSFYFTEWLSNDANDKEIKSVVNASAWITSDTGLAGLTNKLFGLFKWLKSFQTQMQRVTAAAWLINKHSDPLNTVDDDTKKVKINTMPIFTSPHGFYDWLAHSSSLFPAVPNATPPSFAEAFEYSITATKENMTTVMDNLDYDETTHKLMESVLTTGKIVLDKRWEARSMVKEIYDQVAMITGVFWSWSVSETLDSRWLKGIADFVCLVLGFGGLEDMEKSYFKKAFDKNLPSESLPWLQQALAYAKHYLSDSDSPYGPTTHEDKWSVLSQNGLSKAFDTFDYSKHKVGEAIPTKTDLLSLVPTSPALLEDGLEHALENKDGFLPNPMILNQIGMKKYLTNNKEGNLIIDPSKKDELKKALNTDKVRTKLISLACQNTLTPATIVWLAKKGCSQEDTLALIYGFLIAPLDTVKAVEYSLLDGDTLGNDIEITAMVAHGNELAASKAEEAKESAKKKFITDAETAWNAAKAERDKAIDVLEKSQKWWTDEEKVEAEEALSKAKAKVVETKKKLDEVKKDTKESYKPADGLWAVDDEKSSATPFAEPLLTAWLTWAILDKTSEEINKMKLDEKAVIAFDHLMTMEYDAIHAAAIVGNMKVESSFDSTNGTGDSGTAHGLCQRRFDRFDNLKIFAQQQWKDRTDFKVQLDFIKAESWSSARTEGYKERFLAATTIEETTRLFDEWYERSKGTMVDQRIAYAKKIYDSQMAFTSVSKKESAEVQNKFPESFGVRGDSVALWLVNKWYWSIPPLENGWKSSGWLLEHLPTKLLPTTLLFGGRNDTDPWWGQTIANMKALVEKVANAPYRDKKDGEEKAPSSQPILCLMPIPPKRAEWSPEHKSRKSYREIMRALDGTEIGDTWKKRKIIDCDGIKAGADDLHPASYDELNEFIKKGLHTIEQVVA